MATQTLDVRSVVVIGAGVSGVSAAVHLKKQGLNVKVFERSRRAGGIWVFDENVAKDAAYPSTLPSVGDSPEYSLLSEPFKKTSRHDSPMRELEAAVETDAADGDSVATSFAPPGPCYIALKNNVSTIEMELSCQTWTPGTDEFVPHHVLADYIQDSARSNGVLDSISFNTRVNRVQKVDSKWQLEVARLEKSELGVSIVDSVESFDAVVLASGHYHAQNIPDMPGLAKWKRAFPNNVQHSKSYRRPDKFKDKNVFLIGAGVSSIDIAKDLANIARSVFQSSRGGPYDLPSHMLPNNAARVGAIQSFEQLDSDQLSGDGSIPGQITLQSGEVLCGIHHVIVCTGYHVSFPFMRDYHRDGVPAADADETALVTDGQQTHNLHKDIWYITDPTLAVVGAPYHVATFTCFEFQAMAIAAVFAGHTPLPSESVMRQEYLERIERKGAGREFHSLKKEGDEIAYVQELVALVNDHGRNVLSTMIGHTEIWQEAYVRRRKRMQLLFSTVRDPTIDRQLLDGISGC